MGFPLKWHLFASRGLLIAPALLAACFRPTVVDCRVSCGPNNLCPSDMHCSDGLCTRGPECLMRVATGEVHSCALRAGQIKCWGGNRFGQLGVGDTRDRGALSDELGAKLPAVNLGRARTAVMVAAGGRHTCALLDGGQVKCWGDNSVGQLGLGDRRARVGAADLGDELPGVDLGSGRQATAIAAGLWHTCAILDQGVLKCWGANRSGQLGLGDLSGRGDDPDEMGDHLPAIDLGSVSAVTAVATGAYHTCALLATGEVKCWGDDTHGQAAMTGAGGGPASMGDALPPVDLGQKAVRIAVGAFHSCAVLEPSGQIKCWGANSAGQLGLGMARTKMTAGDKVPAVDLGIGRTAREVGLGAVHSCALLDTRRVRCWGYNFDGELGIGDTQNRGSAMTEMGDALPPTGLPGVVRAIAVGANHACAIVATQIFCWGLNTHGQLGVGDKRNRGDESTPWAPVELGL